MSVRAHQVAGHPDLPDLDRSALLVLFRLLKHLHEQTGEARPSVQTLVRTTGLSERTVQRAISRIEAAGIVTVDRGGGRHKANVYRFANPVTLGDTVSDDKPRQQGDTVYSKKPRQIGTETPSNSPLNPVTLGDTRTEERSERSSRGTAAGKFSEAELSADVLQWLGKQGITDPTKSDLARIPSVTVTACHRVLREQNATRDGCEAATKIVLLRQYLPAAIKAEQTATKRTARVQARKEREAAQRRVQEEAIVADNQWQLDAISKLSREDIERGRQAVLERMAPPTRRFHQRFGAHHPAMRANILHELGITMPEAATPLATALKEVMVV